MQATHSSRRGQHLRPRGVRARTISAERISAVSAIRSLLDQSTSRSLRGNLSANAIPRDVALLRARRGSRPCARARSDPSVTLTLVIRNSTQFKKWRGEHPRRVAHSERTNRSLLGNLQPTRCRSSCAAQSFGDALAVRNSAQFKKWRGEPAAESGALRTDHHKRETRE
jgi:hypothetical protein